MALILKEEKSIASPYDQTQAITTAYAVIDEMRTNKAIQVADISVSVYSRTCTKEERRAGIVSPIGTRQYQVLNNDFDTYFSVEAVNADDNPYKQGYIYLMTLDYFADNWQSDEV